MARETAKTGLVLPAEDLETDLDEDAIIPSSSNDEDKLTVLMQQFQALQRTLVDVGAGRIAADGSFLLGRQVEARRQRATLGSDCTCDQCTPHNQQHWICYVCGSGPHEWRTRPPRTERTLMGTAGKAGVRHAVCSDRCGRDYQDSLGRMVSGEPQVPQVPIEKLPRAGGDDGFGFVELNT